MTAARLVARCVHGLEPILAAEVVQQNLGLITSLGHREVRFQPYEFQPYEAARRPTGLRVADDVFLFAAELPDIGPTKDAIAALAELVDLANPVQLLRQRQRQRQTLAGAADADADAVTGVDVSASFLGKRNFSRYDVEDVVGMALARRLGVGYHSRRTGTAPPSGHCGWRLTMDGKRATLMLRITDRPLHRRAYKRRTIPGTLHPPLAAAMAIIADLRPGHTVLDPCCGAGTLLAEAAHVQPATHLYGFDLNRQAVEAARLNTADLGAAEGAVIIERGDAGRLPVPDGSVDRVLCNPPWGGQVHAHGVLAKSPNRWWAELRRVLAPDGMAVLLLPDTPALAAAVREGFTPVYVQRIRVAGAQPYIVHLLNEQRRGRKEASTP